MVWEIQGSTGSLRIEATGYMHFGESEIWLRTNQDPPRIIPLPYGYSDGLESLGPAASGVARMYRQFASDLRDGTSLTPDFETAKARDRVLDAILESARSSRAETIAY